MKSHSWSLPSSHGPSHGSLSSPPSSLSLCVPAALEWCWGYRDRCASAELPGTWGLGVKKKATENPIFPWGHGVYEGRTRTQGNWISQVGMCFYYATLGFPVDFPQPIPGTHGSMVGLSLWDLSLHLVKLLELEMILSGRTVFHCLSNRCPCFKPASNKQNLAYTILYYTPYIWRNNTVLCRSNSTFIFPSVSKMASFW